LPYAAHSISELAPRSARDEPYTRKQAYQEAVKGVARGIHFVFRWW